MSEFPKEPISLKSALADYAGLDADHLMDLQFSDEELSNQEFFRLIKDYKNLPEGQRLILNKILLDGELGARIFSQTMLIESLGVSYTSSDDLIGDFELSLLDSGDDFMDFALDLRLKDPSDDTLRAICHSVKKVAHYKARKSWVLKNREEKKLARSIIAKIHNHLLQHEGNVDLLGMFSREYENQPYEESDKDLSVTVALEDTRFSFVKIDGILAGNPNSTLLFQVFTWLFKRYIESETFRESIKKDNYFNLVFEKVDNAKKAYVLAQVLADSQKAISTLGAPIKALVEEIIRRFRETIKRLAKNPEIFLGLIFYFHSNEQNPFFKEITEEIEKISLPPEKLIKALADSGISLFEHLRILPPYVHEKVENHLVSVSALENPKNLPLIAFYLKRTPHLDQKYQALIGTINTTSFRTSLKLKVQAAMALAGLRDRSTEFDRAVEAGIKALQEAHAQRIRVTTSQVVTRIRAVTPEAIAAPKTEKKPPEPQKKRPGELDGKEFAAAVRIKLDDLKIPPYLASNIGVSGKTNSKIRQDLVDTAEIASDLTPWEVGEEKEIAVEQNSVLARLGIKAIRFRKTGSYEVQFLFKETKEGEDPPAFCAAVHLDDKGQPEALNFDNEPLLKAILELEAARYFCELQSGHPVPEATKEDVLRLLALEEMPATPFEPTRIEPPKAVATPVATPPKKIPVEKPETIEARNLVRENWETFEAFIASLKARGVRVEGDFTKLKAAGTNLTASIKLDKAIPPGGLTVEMDKKHLFGSYIHSIDIFDPEMSRKLMKNLALDPSFVHLDSIDDIDAYFVSANIRLNDKDEQIHACIILPDFNVYIFGVDPKEIIEKERTLPMAFNQMILRAFKTAATRIDDHSSTHERTYKSSSRRGASLVNRKVLEATSTSYPVIVVSWPVPASPKPGQGPSSPAANTEPTNREEQLANMFRHLSTMAVDDGIVSTLIDAGTYLKAADLFRFFSKDPDVKLHQYPDIYMPITSPRIMAGILDIVQNKHVISAFTEKDDPRAWLMDIVEHERKTDPENYESAVIKAFEFAVNNPRTSRLLLDRYFQFQCRQTAKGSAVPYAETLKKVLCESRKSLGENVSVEEVLEALFEMSPLNPKNLYLATSGAGDYRLPYDFRKGGEDMPTKCLFDSGYSVPDGASPEVVKIIAGNRLRFSAVTEDWLRGRSRSEKLSFAAEVQNPFRNEQNKPVDLTPQARALLVYEFEGADDKPEYAYVYLGTARDTKGENVVTGAERLLKYASTISAMERAQSENLTGNHTDFEDLSKWSTSDLLALERRGIFELDKIEIGGRTRVIRIKPGTLRKITRKKVAILTGEAIGYKQFSSEATSFAAYREGAHNQGLLELIEPSLNFNPRRAKIQEIFYETVGMDNSKQEKE